MCEYGACVPVVLLRPMEPINSRLHEQSNSIIAGRCPREGSLFATHRATTTIQPRELHQCPVTTGTSYAPSWVGGFSAARPAVPCCNRFFDGNFVGGSPYPPPPAVTCQPVTNVNIVAGGSGLKPPPRFGPYAVQAHCPRCNLDSFTAIERKNGCLAWLCCFLIFIFGGVFFCCFIPFCCARCQDVQHRCPNCKKQLGYYRRL
nr:unnamed protein product [Spirometra erinaceieuropaei]